MKKNLTEMVFILDKSGSMSGLEADTIGGFNSMIDKQKKEEGEALVSTVLFSNESVVLHDRVDLRKIEPMTDRQYYVGGCTALIDAVGGAIHPSQVRAGTSFAAWHVAGHDHCTPFDPEALQSIEAAPVICSAAANELRVRVEFSKNMFATVIPRRESSGFLGRLSRRGASDRA